MVKRLIYQDLLKQSLERELSILIGPRQVGKSYLLKQLQEELGGLFIDFDIYSNYEKYSSYQQFIDELKLQGYQEDQKEIFYIFIDEFQSYADLTKVFKNIYDHHSNIKIYATGSSSLTIKNAIQESLAGRKIMNYLYPLSFREFLEFKQEETLIKQLDNLKQIYPKSGIKEYKVLAQDLIQTLEEFLIYGAYPKVVLTQSSKKKQEIYESIFDLYIKKDLLDYLKLEKIKNFKTLLQYLAINNGGIVNYSKLATIAELDVKTVKNYLEVLEETYLINLVKPYYRNKTKEISKAPKAYFIDTGVRNYFVNNFNKLELRADKGELVETYYIAELLKSVYKTDQIKYFRTKNDTEVDIVVDLIHQIIPIEIKYKKKIISSDYSALKYLMEEYQINSAHLVNNCLIGKTTLDSKAIYLSDLFNPLSSYYSQA